MSEKRKILIAGNWKMNGLSEMADEFCDQLLLNRSAIDDPHLDILICPPSTLLHRLYLKIKETNLFLGAQDCHFLSNGANTGDLSPEMLKDVGCQYVIVGHSERRISYSESDEIIQSKAEAAVRAGLIPIICVGETEQERSQGRTIDIVVKQVLGSIPERFDSKKIVIAYEPVWAIGTGEMPSIDEVQEVHSVIRRALQQESGDVNANKIQILYGGSVKPDNATGLMALPDIDGALVGGASLSASDFLTIAENSMK